MADCKDHKNPLQRPGTSQADRELPALQPGAAPVHEWSLQDHLRFARELAGQVKFYGLQSHELPTGNWRPFFKQLRDDVALQGFMEHVKSGEGDISPHLALFVAFLSLLKRSQDHLNTFTGRHLDFYYQRVLQLQRQRPVADSAHIIFELAKNAARENIPAGTLLNGGKDNSGKLRHYKTVEEFTASQATVAAMHNLLYYQQALYHAPDARKADGLQIDPENGQWPPFGGTSLPVPEVGVAVGSPVLALQEGDRWVQLSAKLLSGSGANTPLLLNAQALNQYLKVYVSGEEGWLGPFPLQQDDIPQVALEDSETTPVLRGSSLSTDKLDLLFNIPASAGAVVPFNGQVFSEPLDTPWPVLKLVFQFEQQNAASTSGARALYRHCSLLKIDRLYLDVWASGITTLEAESDLGPLDPSKSFLPFGPQPRPGASLYLGNPEVAAKNWQKIELNVQWEDLPTDSGGNVDLGGHYAAYRRNYMGNLAKSNYDLEIADINDGGAKGGGLVVPGNDHFKASISIRKNNNWQAPLPSLQNAGSTGIDLFNDTGRQTFTITPEGAAPGATSAGGGSFSPLQSYLVKQKDTFTDAITNNYLVGTGNFIGFDASKLAAYGAGVSAPAVTRKGFIKLSLQNDFLHRQYPVLYAVAMSKGSSSGLGTDQEAAIPNAPVAPKVASISLNYFATTRQGAGTQGQRMHFGEGTGDRHQVLQAWEQDSVQVFHHWPFGAARQHVFLKDQARVKKYGNEPAFPETERAVTMAPAFLQGGQFLIGLSGLSPDQTVSLLFQVAEGSENPASIPFSEEDKIEWYVLSGNEWLLLNPAHMLQDTTSNLLQSGIVRFLIPPEATLFNRWLPEGHIWLRATVQGAPNRVPDMVAVLPNAVRARFVDRDNNLAHLASALPPETIGKLVNRPAKVKKVAQPFASFGGRPLESPEGYRRRVSERLRHKQRAVSIWDYEHLALQRFPELHKVKCLNHTRVDEATDSIQELAPGHVTLVVVPDLRNKNFYDPLKPRVSQNLLARIEQFIGPLKSLHVRFNAINPRYEGVKFQVEVVFRAGSAPSVYRQQLNSDLVAWLSPWVREPEKGIRFGGVVHKSQVISFIESLPYIDYLTGFTMFHEVGGVTGSTGQDQVQASSSAAILVSVASHEISSKTPTPCP